MSTDKPLVLQASPLMPWLQEQLQAHYRLMLLPASGPERDAFLVQHGANFGAMVTSAAQGASSALMDALPSLKVISSFGVGLDKIDIAHAAQRGIAVGYTPSVLNDCVADMAFGLMLDVARRLSEGDRFVRAGRWAAKPPEVFPLGFKVSGARLGIVGLGRIGRTIAHRATGFDMQVRYHGRHRVDDAPCVYEASLHELAHWADFLVIATAGGAQTHHLIDASVLDALGPQGFIINISRGTVIDEAALLNALQQRHIAGAGLDVYEREPEVPPAFFTLDNVVLSPHMAAATSQTRRAIAQRVLDNLAAFLSGQPMPSAVQG